MYFFHENSFFHKNREFDCLFFFCNILVDWTCIQLKHRNKFIKVGLMIAITESQNKNFPLCRYFLGADINRWALWTKICIMYRFALFLLYELKNSSPTIKKPWEINRLIPEFQNKTLPLDCKPLLRLDISIWALWTYKHYH